MGAAAAGSTVASSIDILGNNRLSVGVRRILAFFYGSNG